MDSLSLTHSPVSSPIRPLDFLRYYCCGSADAHLIKLKISLQLLLYQVQRNQIPYDRLLGYIISDTLKLHWLSDINGADNMANYVNTQDESKGPNFGALGNAYTAGQYRFRARPLSADPI